MGIVMRHEFSRIYDEINGCRSKAQLKLLLYDIRDTYGLSSVAYFFQPILDRADEPPIFITTYSEEWVDHYVEFNFASIDPVLSQGFESFLPTDWAQFRKLSHPTSKKMFNEATEFGIGQNGMTFPIHCNAGKALFSVTNSQKQYEWQRHSQEFAPDFQLLGHAIHSCVRSGHNSTVDTSTLTKRQSECLLWVSVGKTAAETAIILDLSERTVRFYLDEAKQKLKATNITQAAVKASRMNLFVQTYGYKERQTTKRLYDTR